MLDKTKEVIVNDFLTLHSKNEPAYQYVWEQLRLLKLKEGIGSSYRLYSQVIELMYLLTEQTTDRTRLDYINAMMWLTGTFIITQVQEGLFPLKRDIAEKLSEKFLLTKPQN